MRYEKKIEEAGFSDISVTEFSVEAFEEGREPNYELEFGVADDGSEIDILIDIPPDGDLVELFDPEGNAANYESRIVRTDAGRTQSIYVKNARGGLWKLAGSLRSVGSKVLASVVVIVNRGIDALRNRLRDYINSREDRNCMLCRLLCKHISKYLLLMCGIVVPSAGDFLDAGIADMVLSGLEEFLPSLVNGSGLRDWMYDVISVYNEELNDGSILARLFDYLVRGLRNLALDPLGWAAHQVCILIQVCESPAN